MALPVLNCVYRARSEFPTVEWVFHLNRCLLATLKLWVLLWHLWGCLAVLATVVVHRHLWWQLITFVSWQLAQHVEVRYYEKSKRRCLGQLQLGLLQVLFLSCAVSLGIGTYLQILGGNPGQWQWPIFCWDSLALSWPRTQKEGSHVRYQCYC